MKRSYTIVFLVLCFLTGCQTTTQSPEKVISRYYQDGKFNGSVLIVQDNQVIFDTVFGYRDFADQTLLTRKTPLYIASLSKSFTAIAIAILEEKHLLSYNDKAAKFVHDLPDYAHNVTIKQLLNHTSGVDDYENILLKKGLTNNDVVRWLHTRDGLTFAPGTKFKYSNSGYIILASIVENISEMTYAEFLKGHILGPLQMNNTTVYESDTVIPNKAIGYNKNKKVDDYDILTTGDGGIYSTAEDLYKIDKALRENRLLSKKSTRLLYQTPVLQDGTISKYGLGWFIEKTDGVVTAQHTGGLAGFRSLFWRDLKNGHTIIALTNQGDAFPVFNFLNDIKKTLK